MLKDKVVQLKQSHKNITSDDFGIVIGRKNTKNEVLFLNKRIYGDYAYLELRDDELKEVAQLPSDCLFNYQELKIDKTKDFFASQSFEDNDIVEMMVNKYEKYGVTKGMIGIVAYPCAVDDKYLVDFTTVLENERVIGDCISVHAKDIKKIEK